MESVKKAANKAASLAGEGIAAYEKGCDFVEGKIAGKDGLDGKLDKACSWVNEKAGPKVKSTANKVADTTKKAATIVKDKAVDVGNKVTDVTKNVTTKVKDKVVETKDVVIEATPKVEMSAVDAIVATVQPILDWMEANPNPYCPVTVKVVDPRMVKISEEKLPPKYDMGAKKDLKPAKATLKGKVKHLFTKPMVRVVKPVNINK